jgi:hypothetical protein
VLSRPVTDLPAEKAIGSGQSHGVSGVDGAGGHRRRPNALKNRYAAGGARNAKYSRRIPPAVVWLAKSSPLLAPNFASDFRIIIITAREDKSMLEIGVFHNGASSLPVVITKDGVAVNDGSLAEVHAAAQEVLVNQVRQGILAEKLGFQSFWLTEHHFQPEGAEMSPNPLFTQMAIAAQTKKNPVLWRKHTKAQNQRLSLDGPRCGGVERSSPAHLRSPHVPAFSSVTSRANPLVDGSLSAVGRGRLQSVSLFIAEVGINTYPEPTPSR